MTWTSDWPAQDDLAQASVDGGAAQARPVRLRQTLQRLHALPRQRPRQQPHRCVLDPVIVEEQAIAQLYGSRTGTVSSWTKKPPVKLG